MALRTITWGLVLGSVTLFVISFGLVAVAWNAVLHDQLHTTGLLAIALAFVIAVPFFSPIGGERRRRRGVICVTCAIAAILAIAMVTVLSAIAVQQ